jgi:hypothetical protein
MLLLYALKTISGYYPDIAKIPEKILFWNNPFISKNIFYPPGEQISPHRLRCSSFAVVNSRPDLPSSMGYFLAAAAIFARE